MADEAAFCANCGRSMVVAAAPPSPVSVSGQDASAGFALRLGAWIVDGIVVGVAGFLLTVLAGWTTGFLGIAAAAALPAWLYFALQESSEAQATVGKKLVGIRVTDSAGRRLTFGQASIRYVIKAVVTLVPLGAIVSAIVMAADDRARAIHDRAAGTLVKKV